MSRADAERKRLLEAAIEYVAQHGLTELSLRRLAGELGTSHRMLSHYFGSKEGLWVAIVRDVERQQLAAMTASAPSSRAVSYEDAMRAGWRRISDPSLWPNERLFFEVYAQALRGRSPAVDVLDGIVEAWIAPVARLVVGFGVPRKDARHLARQGVAVTRGLLLDLLATNDRTGVDQAMEQWIRVTGALIRDRGGVRNT